LIEVADLSALVNVLFFNNWAKVIGADLELLEGGWASNLETGPVWL
jgi:hypothetical protein